MHTTLRLRTKSATTALLFKTPIPSGIPIPASNTRPRTATGHKNRNHGYAHPRASILWWRKTTTRISGGGNGPRRHTALARRAHWTQRLTYILQLPRRRSKRWRWATSWRISVRIPHPQCATWKDETHTSQRSDHGPMRWMRSRCLRLPALDTALGTHREALAARRATGP